MSDGDPDGPSETYWSIADTEIWEALLEVQTGVSALEVYLRLHAESEWGDVV